MNDKIEINVSKFIWIYTVLKQVAILLFFAFGAKMFGKQILFIVMFYIVFLMIDKDRYLFSASRLIMDNNTIELKLPFRKSITIPMVNINDCKIAGDKRRWGLYFCVKYDGGIFNTYYLSYKNRGSVVIFMEELQRRVDLAKKEKK